VGDWIRRYQNEISLLAGVEGLELRDFACTLLAAVVDLNCALFIQIGDGAIVISSDEKPDEFCWVFWPQQGQYANTTNFLTDREAIDRFEHSPVNSRIDEVALFTDGLQSLALHYESRRAPGPFFRPMFSWLRPRAGGHCEDLSSSLASFLDSSRVNDCTDDDKTLILATRREQVVI